MELSNEQLVLRIQNGEDTAVNMLQLWQQCKNFIARMAKRYKGIEEKEDLQQEGFIGLCLAVDQYNPAAGVPFINYAAYWIQRAMMTYINNCASLIRIPEQTKRNARQYQQEREGGPSADYLSEKQQSTIRAALNASAGQIRSLDAPVPDAEDCIFGDLIPCDTDLEGETLARIGGQELAAVLWPLVDDLGEEKAAVVRMEYQEGLSAAQMGERMGLDCDTVRRYKRQALNDLRKPDVRKQLEQFADEWIYSSGLRGNGAGRFNRTWTSSTERSALDLFERLSPFCPPVRKTRKKTARKGCI